MFSSCVWIITKKDKTFLTFGLIPSQRRKQLWTLRKPQVSCISQKLAGASAEFQHRTHFVQMQSLCICLGGLCGSVWPIGFAASVRRHADQPRNKTKQLSMSCYSSMALVSWVMLTDVCNCESLYNMNSYQNHAKNPEVLVSSLTLHTNGFRN